MHFLHTNPLTMSQMTRISVIMTAVLNIIYLTLFGILSNNTFLSRLNVYSELQGESVVIRELGSGDNFKITRDFIKSLEHIM